MAKQRFSPRQSGRIVDFVHIIFGIAVIAMAILAIANPDKYKVLFPVIFLLASFINAATAWFHLKMFPRNRKKHISGWIYAVTGVLMFALFVISAVSIWGSY